MVFRLIFLLAFLFPSLIESEPAYIIFCNSHNIGRLDLVNNNFRSLASGLRKPVSLDFYYEESWIFWTDDIKKQIFRGKLISYNLTQIEPIIHGDLEGPEGIAVDWVGQNIYWVDKDQIEVSQLDGSHRSVLIAGNMRYPSAIALDPREGALFWTDWDSTNPQIETSSMAGERRRTIFNLSTIDGGGWANGITIDYSLKRLYWVDSWSDSIHSIDYNGQDYLLVLRYHNKIKPPVGITLYENFLYLTEWRTNSLLKVNKFNGANVTRIHESTMSQPFDIKVYHQNRQPPTRNPCDHNSGCSHLCVIGYNKVATCLCPHSTSLTPDGKTCVGQSTVEEATDRPTTTPTTLTKQKATQGKFDQDMTNSTLIGTPKSTSDDKDIKNIWLYVVIILVSVLVITEAIVIIRLRYRRRKIHGQMKLSWSRTQSE